MITAAIQKDLNWCETLIQNNSSSFYRAFRKLPREQAQAVFAIYAFCRIADDAIDVDNNPELVRAMAGKLLAFEAGETPDEPMWRALRWAFDSFPLQIRPFQEMLIGQLQDVDFQQPKSFNHLLDYCYLVAGTVGLMLCPLLAKPVTSETEKLSVELGIAMQLTNILRDVGTDYRLNRIYLPEDLMIALGVSPEDLAGPQPTPELIRLWEHLAGEAESRYRLISANLELFDKTARLPVLLSLLYYSKIINRCRKARYRLLDRRIYVPKWEKLLLFVSANRQLLWASFWR
ncbi:MAG: phytoene/squalene synthase family protein [Acetobacterium sp.]|uniref:phytoene/squalene synthase family protein n=1 Tax=Acetobacterium sp. TaxID=1872094 RepID=UPI0032427FB1